MSQAYFKGKTTPLLEKTIGQHLDHIVAKFRDHPALIMPHQSIRWSYGELDEQVNRLANGFLALDIGKGDRVGIWSPNRYEWILTQFATAKIGAIMVCINPAYRLFELEYALNKVQCKAIVTAETFKSSHYLDMLNELAPELRQCEPGKLESEKLPHLKSVIRMGDMTTPGMYNFSEVCAKSADNASTHLTSIADSLQPDDIINIQFTSGTTGKPKGAALTHRNILNNAHANGLKMRFTQEDRLCIPVPLYHCFGMVMGTLCCIAHGATMVLPSESFEPEATLQAVAEEKCTGLHGVPTMFFAELDLPDLEKYDLSSLRTGMIAGATCPESLMTRLIGDLGLSEIVIAYGQTECSPVNHATEIDDSFVQRTSTVGRPHDNWECKIINPETGELCHYGETGEVCSRGYGVMSGYWDDPERTADTIDSEGYLHSGDLGEMDVDGFVKITGRIKDMIIRGGENIYPAEIEEFLYTHPDIREIQVFGIPDEKYGEQVAAWILLAENATTTEEGIREFCAGQITHFKIPRYIKFVNDYPMTVTGKMQKFVMREQYAKELGLA